MHCLAQPKDRGGLQRAGELSEGHILREEPLSRHTTVFSLWLGRSHGKAITLRLHTSNRLVYSEEGLMAI